MILFHYKPIINIISAYLIDHFYTAVDESIIDPWAYIH